MNSAAAYKYWNTMRFFTSILVAVAACATVLTPAVAVNPGNNSLHINVTDAFEAAILKEFGQDVFDGLAVESCNVRRCFGVVTHNIACLTKCAFTDPTPTCVYNCLGTTNICPCIDCLPKFIIDFLHKLGICVHG
ncbi:hypothetical protein AB1N83_006080 [Pleurotus pulmonarius]